mmetsp:Transcript_16094/g.40676  ORF Transcript_16094/g.40676 Transcript_16094/m.40676 type:complete len:290 (+) Transcript_16094:255-1124(+)
MTALHPPLLKGNTRTHTQTHAAAAKLQQQQVVWYGQVARVVASHQVSPFVMALKDHLPCKLSIFDLLIQPELVFVLAFECLVCTEPLSYRTHLAWKVLLDVIQCKVGSIKGRGRCGGGAMTPSANLLLPSLLLNKRVISTKYEELPVHLAFIDQAENTNGDDLAQRAHFNGLVTELHSIERVAITKCADVNIGIHLLWVFVCLRDAAIVECSLDAIVARSTFLYILRDWVTRFLCVYLHFCCCSFWDFTHEVQAIAGGDEGYGMPPSYCLSFFGSIKAEFSRSIFTFAI